MHSSARYVNRLAPLPSASRVGKKRYHDSMFLVAAAVLAASAFAADRFEPIRAEIRKQLTARGVPSLSIALAEQGRIVWEEGFGWADRERRMPATEHTLYSLASISKPVTATALMILVERGAIDLDKPIDDYLGAAKIRARVGNPREATVRRVASHSAGLPLHYQFFYADEPHRRPSMDETILRYANLVTAPGERYQYSNLGYGLLDYAITRVSGRPWEDFLREEVFIPLGMTRSSGGLPAPLAPYASTRYTGDGAPIPYYDFDHPGGSAVWASAHDLARFGMFHLGTPLEDQKRILRAESIAEMMRSAVSTGEHTSYGIGWAIAERQGAERIVSHTGSMGGVATSLRLVPSKKIALAVLCNANNSLPHDIADAVFRLLMPGWQPPVGAGAAPTREFRPGKELAGKWKGEIATYKASIPFSLDIRDDGEIVAQLGRQLRTLWSAASFRDGYLTGQMSGDVGTEDANRRPYVLQFSLKLRGGVLNGAATASSLPAQRAGNALTSWAELRRQ